MVEVAVVEVVAVVMVEVVRQIYVNFFKQEVLCCKYFVRVKSPVQTSLIAIFG